MILACATATDASVNFSRYVPQRPSKVPIAPMGKMLTRLLRLSLCTTGNASVNYSMYVPQRPSKVPIAPMVFSHLSRFVFAGWRCVHRRWHSELLMVHHHWQHSYWSACSRSKVPIAPMGIPADLPNRLSSFNSDRYLDLSGICTCQPHLQTSHRPDGKIADVLALTLA